MGKPLAKSDYYEIFRDYLEEHPELSDVDFDTFLNSTFYHHERDDAVANYNLYGLGALKNLEKRKWVADIPMAKKVAAMIPDSRRIGGFVFVSADTKDVQWPAKNKTQFFKGLGYVKQNAVNELGNKDWTHKVRYDSDSDEYMWNRNSNGDLIQGDLMRSSDKIVRMKFEKLATVPDEQDATEAYAVIKTKAPYGADDYKLVGDKPTAQKLTSRLEKVVEDDPSTTYIYRKVNEENAKKFNLPRGAAREGVDMEKELMANEEYEEDMTGFEAMDTSGLESFQALLAQQLEKFGSAKVIDTLLNSQSQLNPAFKDQLTYLKNVVDLSDTQAMLAEITSAAETLLDNTEVDLASGELEQGLTEFDAPDMGEEIGEYQEPEDWDTVDQPIEEEGNGEENKGQPVDENGEGSLGADDGHIQGEEGAEESFGGAMDPTADLHYGAPQETPDDRQRNNHFEEMAKKEEEKPAEESAGGDLAREIASRYSNMIGYDYTDIRSLVSNELDEIAEYGALEDEEGVLEYNEMKNLDPPLKDVEDAKAWYSKLEQYSQMGSKPAEEGLVDKLLALGGVTRQKAAKEGEGEADIDETLVIEIMEELMDDNPDAIAQAYAEAGYGDITAEEVQRIIDNYDFNAGEEDFGESEYLENGEDIRTGEMFDNYYGHDDFSDGDYDDGDLSDYDFDGEE